MENNGNTQEAINEIQKCYEALNTVRFALYDILDSVIVGEESSDKTSILEAWNGLSDSLSRQREYVLSVISEAEEEKFGTLDSVVKADYWTRVNATKQALENTLNQTSFYQLLSRVEHTQQTVDFLWDTFESVKAYLFILHRHQQLQARGIKRHTNRCIKVRNRLCNEITNLMNLLEEAIRHPTFETMETERRELYHAKWHTYLQKCDQLNGN
ncbi:hypothetical protein KA071_02035 [Candidatus Gracilibacteria bacterium]|nr:hypothetical protein [Candidatus Gracilibacteria bacterium]